MWNSEIHALFLNKLLGRSWYEINADDPLFLFWGHSHLLGTGIKGRLNAFKRELIDYSLGYCRANAYKLDKLSMDSTFERLLKFRPAYLIGYSRALDLLARTRSIHEINYGQNLNIKAVIGAAEAFPFPDSQEVITRVFNAPIGMEYGSVETLLMAHTFPESNYRVFWDTYFLEAIPTERKGVYSVVVTKLVPASTPLIRYQIEDEIKILNGQEWPIFPVLEFDSVIGRCNEFVETNDGVRLHSEVFTHAVRQETEVLSYQLRVDKENFTLFLLLKGSLSSELEKRIRKRMVSVHPELEKVIIRKSSKLKQSIAGKTSWVTHS